MSMEKVVKSLSFIAIVGGIVRIGMAPSGAIWGTDSMPELMFGIVACLLMGIGIFGIYLHASDQLGMAGLVAVIMLSVSSTLTTALVWNNMLGLTWEDHDYIGNLQGINSIMMLIGMLIFCFLVIRKKIYPLWAVVLFLLFPFVSFIPMLSNYAAVLWGISFIVFGYYAFTNRMVRSSSNAYSIN